MTDTIPKRLQGLLEQSVKDFFQANGISDIDLTSNVPPTYQWSGIIGMAGELITGSLTITCQDGILNATHPNHSMGMPVLPGDLVDWLGEIANQVLGRLKNLVLEYGVSFTLASPSVVKGESLAVPKQGKSSVCSMNFKGGDHAFTVVFAANINPKFDFDTAVRKESNAVAEGGGMLF